MKKLALFLIIISLIFVFFAVNSIADFYVIPAQNKCSSCKGTRSTGGRWCDNGNGTVTDRKTCLIWLKYAKWGGARKWEDCSTHNDAETRTGLLENGETIFGSGETAVLLTDGSVEGDWRLPTKTELSGIINEGGETVCAANPQLFDDIQSSYYWSSTTSDSTANAHVVYMVTGFESVASKSSTYYVWPVRGGN